MLLQANAHRVLDYVTVAGFAIAPTVLHFGGTPAVVAYALAAIHLLLTLATAFPGSGRRPVPMGLHSITELGVGIALLVLPWFIGWSGPARNFFVGAGVVILAVWVLSSYSDKKRHSHG